MAKKFDKSAFIGQFKEETNEHLAQLEKDILSLEKNPRDTKLIEDMMREAHTLKGSSTMMGYKRIADLAHKFENAVLQIKGAKIKPTDSHFELLFRLLDAIKPLLEDKLTWPDKGVAYPIEKPKALLEEGREEEASPRPATAIAEPTESIRVDVEKVSQLMNLVGELVVGKIGIDQRKKDLDGFSTKIRDLSLKKEFTHIIEGFERTADEVGLVTSQLQDSVMGVRMLPLEAIFHTFPRAVRDLSKEQDKIVEFNISGEETELDKTVIEKIHDPLMHLLRNAVSHGIESSQERKKLGKPETGRIDLRAYCKGSQVIIEVEDDGRGIDVNELKQAAINKGFLSQEEASQMSDAQALYLLSTPGLSTEKGVSLISGRGVGLNVVKTNVTQLKGALDIGSELGKGTKFTIKLPLTLAITLALFVKVYNETFAIPLDNVEETLRIAPDEIKKVSYVAGAAILGTGEVVLILDIPALTLEAAALPGLVRFPERLIG